MPGRARDRLAAALLAAAVLAVVGAALMSRGGRAPAITSVAPPARSGAPEVMAFLDAHPAPAARWALQAHLDTVSAVAPGWLALDGPRGTFRYQIPDAATSGFASRGALVAPVLRDPAGYAGRLLRDAPVRRLLAHRLARALGALGTRGLVLDLQRVPPAARAAYPAFVRDLRAALGPAGRVYVTVPAAVTRAALRAARGYDFRDLARPATLIVRAWDQHSSATEPGPVASLAFFRTAVRLAVRRAPRARVLIGIPSWGWTWTGGGRATRATQAQLFPAARPRALLDPDGAGMAGPGPGATSWVESDRSVQLKLLVARNAQVAGVALWVRGGESTRLWTQPLMLPRATTPS
jgi:hypothetical protein